MVTGGKSQKQAGKKANCPKTELRTVGERTRLPGMVRSSAAVPAPAGPSPGRLGHLNQTRTPSPTAQRRTSRPPPPTARGPGTHQAEEVTVTIFQAGPVRHEGGTHRPSQQPPAAPQPTIRHYRRLRPERETQTPGRAGGCWLGGPWKRRPPGRPPSPPTPPPPPRAAPAARHPAARGRGPEAGGPCRAHPAGRTAAAAEPADARPSLGDREDVCPFHKKNKLHNK